MTVYDTTNDFTAANPIFDTGMVGGSGQTNLPYATTDGLTIIINQFGNTNGVNGDQWTFSAGGVSTNFYYLTFTEDTNLTATPIKFATPPFVPVLTTNSTIQTNITDFATVTNFVTNTVVVANDLYYQPEQSSPRSPAPAPPANGRWRFWTTARARPTTPRS